MPKPIYILVAESVIESKANLVTAVNLLESVHIAVRPTSAEGDAEQGATGGLIRWSGVAVWMKEAADEGRLFESQWEFQLPNQEPRVLGESREFTFGTDKHLQRWLVQVGFYPVRTSGIAWLRHRVRACGTAEWLTQEYPIRFSVAESDVKSRE